MKLGKLIKDLLGNSKLTSEIESKPLIKNNSSPKSIENIQDKKDDNYIKTKEIIVKGKKSPSEIRDKELSNNDIENKAKLNSEKEIINKKITNIDDDNLSSRYKDLNHEQFIAATWKGGNVLVLAGAGCGKTKTIISRAQYLIEEELSPRQIQILTFTRKSSAEIVERVKSKLGKRAEGLRASTFHTWCMSLIRRAPKLFGCKGFTVIDRDDQKIIFSFVRSALKESKDPRVPKPNELCEIYSYARNVGATLREALEKKSPNSLELFDVIAEIVTSYESRKEDQKYLDYDDILDVVARQIEKDSEVRDWICSNYSELLVDEFQDTNPLQWKLLKPLIKTTRIFCVGDDAQSIYGFRGADFQNVHSFKEKVADSSILKLSLNYRSTQEILDLSNWLLSNSSLNYGKSLKANRGKGIKPHIHSFANEWLEASWIANNLQEMHSEGYEWKDNMILTRTAFSARALEAALLEKNIPYKFIGGQRLFDAAHVKDVMSALRVIANPQDELGWMRYLKLWEGVGDKTAANAIKSFKGKVTINECIKALLKIPKITNKASQLLEISSQKSNTAKTFNSCFQGLKDTLKQKYKTQNWEKRIKDFKVIEKLALNSSSILEFLEAYILEPIFISEPIPSDDNDVVTLITIYSAKGAELKRCYVINVSPGGFPLTRSLKSDYEIEEERRVLYVALTRAKDELIITRSGMFSYASAVKDKQDSNDKYFLANTPHNLFIDKDHRFNKKSNKLKSSKISEKKKPSTNLELG